MSLYTPYIRLAALGIGWFYLASAVESSVMPIKDLMFEHRTYLPGIGIVMTVMSGALLVMCIAGISYRAALRSVIAGTVVAAVVLGWAAFERNNIWLSELNLWNDVVSA